MKTIIMATILIIGFAGETVGYGLKIGTDTLYDPGIDTIINSPHSEDDLYRIIERFKRQIFELKAEIAELRKTFEVWHIDKTCHFDNDRCKASALMPGNNYITCDFGFVCGVHKCKCGCPRKALPVR